jgi:N-acetylmuramoyl-L-alanine amidase
MRRARAAIAAAAGLVLGAATGGLSALGELSSVERIRYIGAATYSRVVVDLSSETRFSLESIPANRAAGTPDRLVIDIGGATVGPEAREPLSVGDTLLRGIRTGQYTADTARIVLDLAAKVKARTFLLPDPVRLVIDLRGEGVPFQSDAEVIRLGSRSGSRTVSGGTGRSMQRSEPDRGPVEGGAGAPVGAPISQRRDDEARGRLGSDVATAARERARGVAPPASVPSRRFKVMLDPGHGGRDPGARGVRGLEEKEITLAIARLVADRLRTELGIEVLLTRSDDRTLALEERTGLANAAGADLFVSIHANAAPSSSSRGIEVYYLNNTNNRGTLRLAAMENNLHWDPRDPSLQSEIPDLSYILSDLRQTYKVEESRQLADHLDSAMHQRLSDAYEGVQDLGVKEGPFYVLVGAYMPCVLVEVSFITNPVEGARLATTAYRRALADGITDGIQRYIAQTRLAKTL